MLNAKGCNHPSGSIPFFVCKVIISEQLKVMYIEKKIESEIDKKWYANFYSRLIIRGVCSKEIL